MITTLLLASAFVAQPSLAGGAPVVVSPDRLPVNLSYNGSTLALRVRLPEGDGGVVKLAAPPVHLALKEKGRVGGLLWMNVADVELDDVPVFYYLVTTGVLREMVPPAERARWELGYEALLPDGGPAGAFRDQLVRLKERDGFYRVIEGGLTRIGAADGGGAIFEGTLALPARLPPGNWQVELFGVDRGRVSPLAEARLVIEYAGLTRLVRQLALDHGTTYGWASVAIAIVVGLLTGVLFGARGQKGH